MTSQKAPLRAVKPDEKAPARKKRTVTDAAENGSTLELLVAMRSRIAKAVEDPNTPARDLAALTKRLVEVVRDIEAIVAQDEQEVDHSGDVSDSVPFDAASL